jgi:ComF family protein
VVVYEAAAREAIHALKYKGVSALATAMARAMVETLSEWAPPVETIVPVPLTGHRRRLRGYNQSQLLAREVARFTGLPLELRAIARRRSGAPQVSQPDRESRRRNVDDAFAPGSKRIEGGVLLIDDVMTTGATLNACARVLVSAGAGPVFAVTFARDS